VIETRTPITFLDVRLGAGDALTQAVPRGHASFAYVYKGKGVFGPDRTPAGESSMLQLGDGDEFTLAAAPDSPCHVLLLAGEPIRDPIARYGPFVMNTREEIYQAFEDFEAGRMGEIPGADARRVETDKAKARQQASGTWGKDEAGLK
jgi:redox-sensitive bicupin YhaK (pirin superfamily)